MPVHLPFHHVVPGALGQRLNRLLAVLHAGQDDNRQVGRRLLDGEPRIMSHAEGDGHSFIIRPVAMQPGDYKLVAARLANVLRSTPEPRPEKASTAVDISGKWRVTVQFVRGSAEHQLELTNAGASVRGTHRGTANTAEIRGSLDGNRISLRGEGDSCIGGGPRGDLLIDIRVKEHPLFQREDRHLRCRVPLTYPQAVLGAELEIPVLKGRHLLKIPPGTQPGEVIRLRGFGMPDVRGGANGDLFVQIQLEVPKKVSKEEEDLLRNLADLKHADVTPQRKSFFDKLKEYFTGQEESEK